MKNLFASYRKENVLVLLDFESYNPNTILRGAKLAEAFECNFSVLFLEHSHPNFSKAEMELYLTESKKLSDDLKAEEYVIETFEKYNLGFKFLEQYAEQREFTQLVHTHIPESRWEELVSGTFANYVLKRMPFLEIHFIAPDIAFPYDEWEFDKGIYGFLEPTNEPGEFLLVSNRTDRCLEDGVFFKKTSTDFNNGKFVSYSRKGNFNQYNVVGGIATKID